jgi:hypothetical protein
MVLIKILSISMSGSSSGRLRYTGKIREVGKEMVDCIGFLPRTESVLTSDKYLEGFYMAAISHVNYTTNGGTSVMMQSDLFPVTMEIVHADSVPASVMYTAVDHNVCDCCGRQVKIWERAYTSIRLKGKHGEKTVSGGPLNVVEMTCPQCVADKMGKDSEFRKQFEENYEEARKDHLTAAPSSSDSSVSDGKSQRPRSSRTAGGTGKLSSSPTLH